MTARETPNVVVIVMDTARASEIGSRTAPALTALGADGTRFTDAHATAPWTLPSHGSLFTGLYPSKHGAHAEHERLDDTYPTIAELLGEAGYETVAVTNNTWVTPEAGFDRGFDTFRKAWQYLPGDGNMLWEMVQIRDESRLRGLARSVIDGNPIRNTINAVYSRYLYGREDDGANRTVSWIDDWLTERENDDPFFLFANFIEPHLDYEPPEEYAERFLPEGVSYDDAMSIEQDPWEFLVGNTNHSGEEFATLRALYRASIAYLDDQIDRLRDSLEEAGEWEDTVFVVMGDHGENIDDHELMDHQYCLYDTLLNVPLVIHGGPFDGGGRNNEYVSLLDLAPTLLDVAGIDAEDARSAFQGRSVHPDADTEPPETLFAEYMAPQPTMAALEQHTGKLPEHVTRFDRSLRSIRADSYKLIRGSDGSRELYHVAEDPGEQHDLSDEIPERVDELEKGLDDWLQSFDHAESSGEIDISGERKRQLEELGYLQ